MSDDLQPRQLPHGSTDPRVWLQFVGLIEPDDLRLMEEAIQAATEQVET